MQYIYTAIAHTRHFQCPFSPIILVVQVEQSNMSVCRDNNFHIFLFGDECTLRGDTSYFWLSVKFFVLKWSVWLQLKKFWSLNQNSRIWIQHITPHNNCFTALFPGPPGWAGARRELLDFTVQGKINRGRHTDHTATAIQCTPSKKQLCISELQISRTLLTLMDGNIFWNMVAISLRCMPSPLKWFIISRGWQRNCDWVAWFRFSIETTSRLSEYECTLNVIVGPRGRRTKRMCVDASDLENVTRWVTFSGPAMLMKSFSTFFLLTYICNWTQKQQLGN